MFTPQTTLKSFESQEATATSQLSAGIRPAGLGGAKRCEAVVFAPGRRMKPPREMGVPMVLLVVNLWLIMVNL